MKTIELIFVFLFLLQPHTLGGKLPTVMVGNFTFEYHPLERDIQKRLKNCYPYISGDVFRNFCDFVFDETNPFFDLKKVRDGDVIFVKNRNDFLDYFFEQYHPHIEARYILITHNALSNITTYEEYLDDERLAAWFGKNMILDHPKAFHIPLGLPNECWNDVKNGIDDTLKHLPAKEKLLYMNFDTPGDRRKRIRERVFKIFRRKRFCFKSKRKNFKKYLFDVARSKFIMSPEGQGIDCYRTWESLLMGSIPIVTTSKIDCLFKDLPVLIINDWPEITEQFLNEKYKQMCQKEYNMEKLYADYWLDKIRAVQEKIRSGDAVN